MKAKLIRIGNSKGIRLPKAFIKQIKLEDDIDMRIDGTQLIISPAEDPRAGWATAYQAMAERGDDIMLDKNSDLTANEWDELDWRW